MVNAQAICVDLGGVREGGGIGRYTRARSCIRRPCHGQGIYLEIRLHGRDGCRPRGQVRDGGDLRVWLNHVKSFIREEKERLVLADWTAEHAPEVVLDLRRLGQTVVIDEPVSRI